MSDERRIDRQRDAAITLRIGGEDRSPITYSLSTGGSLYVLKENGVYKIQLADNIDPGRTNPDIPNLNQQVLTEGSSNEIVARILLTAKYLFDENNAAVKPFVADLIEYCIVLTRQVLELDTMTRGLAAEISEKEITLAGMSAGRKISFLPSVPSLDTKLHNILVKADKVKDAILMVCRLQFLPDTEGRPELKKLKSAVVAAFSAEPELAAAWEAIDRFLWLIRNMRNASEHQPKDNHRVVLSDFSMQASGKIDSPLVAVRHPDTPIETVPVAELISFIQNAVLDHAERMLVLIRYAALLKENPFREWVVPFPEEERLHKFVRYYRAINMGGAWRILS